MKNKIISSLFLFLTLTACASQDKSEDKFTGFDENEINIQFNSSVNNKMFDLNLFCYDDKGNVYFSNPKDNFKVYAYDENSSEKLTDVAGTSLNYYNDKLYFLSENAALNTENIRYGEGILYEYDLNSKVKKQVSSSSLCGFTVIDDKFYTLDLSDEACVCSYDINTDSKEKLYNGFSVRKYNDYFLTLDKNKYYLENDENKLLFITDDIPLYDNFYKDKYYYISQNDYAMYDINLLNGEKSKLSDNINDYTFLNDDLYLIKSDMYLYKYDGKDFERIDDINQYQKIYSDNKNLYGIKSEYNEQTKVSKSVFVKINNDMTIVNIG